MLELQTDVRQIVLFASPVFKDTLPNAYRTRIITTFAVYVLRTVAPKQAALIAALHFHTVTSNDMRVQRPFNAMTRVSCAFNWNEITTLYGALVQDAGLVSCTTMVRIVHWFVVMSVTLKRASYIDANGTMVKRATNTI